jgi:hypothetical protein
MRAPLEECDTRDDVVKLVKEAAAIDRVRPPSYHIIIRLRHGLLPSS